MSSEVASAIARHDPTRWSRTLGYRAKAGLPYDIPTLGPSTPLLFDTTVYIDQLKAQLPGDLVALISSRTVPHGARARSELAVTIGALDPSDPRIAGVLGPIRNTLRHISRHRIIVPQHDVWLDAGIIAGILARTQGIPREHRRKFLNDVLMFLMAAEAGAVLISRNSRDLDLLLQLKPSVYVLLYDKLPS